MSPNNNILTGFEPDLQKEISEVGNVLEFAAGEDLIKPNDFIKFIPLLLQGSIKIMRPDDQGDELLLYHIEQGDTCAVTLNCCMGRTRSEIRAVTETPVRLIMIPIAKMEQWSSTYKSWRNFIFNSYHQRMMELLDSIDTIAFLNMEERLELYLENKAKVFKSKHLPVTHKEIAADLHTSRVVISRLLKKMEKEELITLNRGSIELL